MDSEDKIELIIQVCHKCADILKDPTEGGSKDLSAELRTQAREDAYDDLMTAIDTLASCAQYHDGFFDIINIASKLKLNNVGQK